MERRKHRKHRFMKVLVVILTVIVMWKLIGNVGSWVRQWQLDEEYGVSAQNMSIHDAKEKAPQKLSTTQIKKRLHSLAKKDSAYQNIMTIGINIPPCCCVPFVIMRRCWSL